MKGFNAQTGKVEDLMEAGVIDAAPIVLGAIRNALGLASTILTCYSVITLPPPTPEELLNKSVMRPAFF